MNEKWGQKRKCMKCETSFYDMGKKAFVCPKCKTKYTEESYFKAKEKHLNKMVKKDMPRLDDEDLDTETLLKMTDSFPTDEEGMGQMDDLDIDEENEVQSSDLDDILGDYSDEKEI